jgi:hypothetical protein
MTIVLSEGRRIARKPHKCFECYRTISPGTEYLFQTCKNDYVYTLACHIECHTMDQEWRDLADAYYDDEEYGPLRDALCESGEYLAALDDFREAGE